MQNPIKLADLMNVVADVMVDELKSRIGLMRGNILKFSSDQIVHDNDVVAGLQHAIRKMRANETRPACDQDSQCPIPL